MNKPAAFRATYSDWKPVKTRRVIQVIFEVPWEAHDGAYQALGGMPDPGAERWFGIARLDAAASHAARETASEPPGTEAVSRLRKPVALEKRLAQQAGICCSDPVFQRFLFEHDMIAQPDEEQAKLAVYLICSVKSRADIIPGTPAGELWNDLYSKYIAWKLAA